MPDGSDHAGTPECHVCGSVHWVALPEIARQRSITTSGTILSAPLAKAHCSTCGCVQRTGAPFFGSGSYYETQYAAYYARPGARQYERARYRAMARWMSEALKSWSPGSILDAGCGAGWSMLATREQYPQAQIEGIEPSEHNAAAAAALGFRVRVQRAGHNNHVGGPYDLIYANNVLMHTVSPFRFLRELGEGLRDDGRVVIICPDASEPSNELLWADHSYSFLPVHIRHLARRAGLELVQWQSNSEDVTLLNKQLCVLAKRAPAGTSAEPERMTPDIAAALFDERCAYIDQWRRVSARLRTIGNGSRRVLNFGSSMWTWLLAAYCPEYWHQVTACLIDDFPGRCLNKDVLAVGDVGLGPTDCVVLGVNPRTQPAFKERLRASSALLATWNDCVRC